jgi:hypothetical protein
MDIYKLYIYTVGVTIFLKKRKNKKKSEFNKKKSSSSRKKKRVCKLQEKKNVSVSALARTLPLHIQYPGYLSSSTKFLFFKFLF